ncbi:MAG: MBL fold metallo-hydrolase [Eubacteriales bacterium]
MRKAISAILVLILVLGAGCFSKQPAEKDTFIYTFPGREGTANSYVAANDGKAAVIDPADPGNIIALIQEKKLTPEFIILTHGHFDHISGIQKIREQFPGIKVLVHPGDMDKLADPVKNLSTKFGTGFAVTGKSLPLREGTGMRLGKTSIEVISTPGHTPGSICLKVGSTLFSGDTLFKGATGRTDFPGGSPEDLMASLKKLARLPEDTKILPGHGEPGVLGEEKKSNPYLAGGD